MDRFINTDRDVAKYVHEDGSETSIKIAPGCSGRADKMVAFISSSVGCQMSCKMCYLTTKKVPYKILAAPQIRSNVSMALHDALQIFSYKPLKISFMGMGEALSSKLSCSQLQWLIESIMSDFSGLISNDEVSMDGIDIGTCISSIGGVFSPDLYYFSKLRDNIFTFMKNENIDISKNVSKMTGGVKNSFLRIFYSLHSTDNDIRKWLIPQSVSVDTIGEIIKNTLSHAITPVIHYTLLDGINDSSKDCISLLNFIKKYDLEDVQIRLLTYNKCANSILNTSKRANEFVEMLTMYHEHVKYQISPGKEVMSACGMFIGRK